MDMESTGENNEAPRRTSLAMFRKAVQRVAASLHHLNLGEQHESHKTSRTSRLGRYRSRTMDDGELHKETKGQEKKSPDQTKESARQKSNSLLPRHQSHPQLSTSADANRTTELTTGPATDAESNSFQYCKDRHEQPSCSLPEDPPYVRVYKKLSSSGKLAIYLTERDLVIKEETVSPMHGVVSIEPEKDRNMKIFAQIVLTFRYGRDDEEVMGLKLSNESIICMEQIHPSPASEKILPRTPSQEILLKRLGPTAYPLNLKLNRVAPPSVRLLPASEYHGAPIGISYDLRVFTVEGSEERPQRKNQVRMAIRLVQYAPEELHHAPPPKTSIEKNFLLREGAISLHVGLDRQWYVPGAAINVRVHVNNRSSKTIRKIRVTAIQHVDVSMFSNGKFKNMVATTEECSGIATPSFDKEYSVNLLENCAGRHWIALEDRYGRLTPNMASTTLKSSPSERNFFAIYISYYVKVRLILNGVGGDITAKVPFILMREGPETIEEEFTLSDKLPTKDQTHENAPESTQDQESQSESQSNPQPESKPSDIPN